MTTHNLHGRPIYGDISHYGEKKPVKQWPTEKFLEQLDALLAHPEVESVRWTQYTPYFNDGDPCEFSTHELYLKLVGDDDSGENEDGFRTSFDLGDWPEGYYDTHSRWDKSKLPFDPVDYIPNFEAADPKSIIAAFETVGKSMAHYEAKFREVFGDPARVTATRGGFDVEHYDHD